ncbi:hypothetical protein FRY77_29475, partial [Halomonas sp. MG34]|nr:hypothetical protein [Halomonas sp. MG34]
MAELYIFSQDEQLLTILSEDTGLVSAPYRIEVNSVPTQPFSLTVEADHENAVHVKDENKVVFKDHEGDWRMMVIRELDDSDTADGPETTATCEPVFLAELNDHIVVDRRLNEQTADVALNAAVEGTRWIGEVLVELGIATTNFYYLSSTEAIWNILSTWGGEFKDVVVFNEEINEILACKVQLLQRRGAEHGQWFEIYHNTTEIGRTVLSYPKTALYGRGASLQTENDGYTRYIDFANVEWKVANGDPVDKPLGQKWVGDPKALAEYGYNKGTKHRYGIYSDQDYEDPEELLWATWQNLQTAKKPEVNYRLSVDLFEEKVSLGDTASAIDRKFARPIEIQARVIAMEYDLLDIEGTMVVEMGQFIDLDDNRIDQLEKEVEKIGSRPAKVTEGSYPDTKPGTPINVETEGGMEVIQLRWGYDSAIYIKHYEVYGSRTQDFVPDTQHLLWRGNTSGFEHRVGTAEVWYYRVRAVNYHGTVGDFSAQVTGTTHRVLSEDILFNEDTAARLRELNALSDIVGVDGISIENISQAAKDLLKQEAVDYTDEQITITRNQLLGDIADKADLSYVEGQLVDKVNKGEVYTISDIDGMFTNTVSITRYTTDMDGIVQNLQSHSTSIEQNEKAILARVETSTFNNETGAIRQSIADVQFYAEGIETTVSNIQIGGRNLLPNTHFKNNFGEWTVQGHVTLLSEKFQGLSVVRSYDPSTTLSSSLRSKKIDVEPGQTYTLSFYGKTDNSGVINRVYFFDSLGNQTRFVNVPPLTANEDWKLIEYTFATDANEYSLSVFMGYFWSTPTGEMFFTSPMLEKGNKATDWTPAPEDADQRMTQAESRITQLADEIDLKVDVDGIVSQINLKKEGIRISGNLIHLDGLTLIDDGVIQNAHIANGTIERAKLGRAIIGEAQIEDLAVTAAKIASVNADRSNAGAIRG